MPRFRKLSAALVAAVLAAACDSAGEHNVPDEAEQGPAQRDSLADGTATPVTVPPMGTVNPAAASGPDTIAGTLGDGALAPAASGPATASPPDQPPSAPGSDTAPAQQVP